MVTTSKSVKIKEANSVYKKDYLSKHIFEHSLWMKLVDINFGPLDVNIICNSKKIEIHYLEVMVERKKDCILTSDEIVRFAKKVWCSKSFKLDDFEGIKVGIIDSKKFPFKNQLLLSGIVPEYDEMKLIFTKEVRLGI